MPEDKPAPPANAFQDMLLELMVANENLEKLNKGNLQITEHLNVIEQSLTDTPLTQRTVGEQIPKPSDLESMHESAASLNWLISIQESLLAETIKGLGQIHTTLVGIDRGLEVIIDIMAGNRLQALEDRKEKQNSGLVPGVAKSKTSKPDSGNPLGFLGTIAAIAVAITSFLVGVVAGITATLSTVLVNFLKLTNTLFTKFLGSIAATFTKLLKSYAGTKIVALLSAITKPITTGLNSILEAFKNTKLFRTIRVSVLRFISGTIAPITKSITTGINSVLHAFKNTVFRFIGGFKDLFTAAVGKISNIFRTIKASLFLFLRGNIMTELKALFPIIKRVQTWVTSIFQSVAGFGKYMGRIATVFFKIGKVFGKFAGWVGIIMSAVGAIMDAVDAFKKTGNLAEAIRVGVTGFISAFSFGIADLLKDAVSWIAGALGFKEVEKMLDSFSFSTMFEAFSKRIFAWGQGIFESFFGNIYDVFDDISKAFASGNITDTIFEILRGSLKTLLALPADMLKNTIASLTGFFGAKKAENWLRSFSFQKMFGGTHTETLAEQTTSGKSIVEEGSDILVENKLNKAKAKENAEIEANAEKKENELKEEKDKDPISQFYDALIEAYRENSNPGQKKEKEKEKERLASAEYDQLASEAYSSKTGATILAAAVESKEILAAQAAGNNQQIIEAAPPARKAQTNVTNNNQSVSYNNTPDRTDRAVSGWMSPYGFGAR